MGIKLSRRNILAGAAATGGLLAMPSIVRAQEKVVNILGASQFFPESLRDRFFQETGIRVQYRQGTTDASQTFNLLASEGTRETDIVLAYGHRNFPFIAAGYFEEIDESMLPGLSKINPVYLDSPAQKIDGVRYGIPVSVGLMLSSFRNSTVVEEHRNSWETIFGDDHAGRLSWRSGGLLLTLQFYLDLQDAWFDFENTPEGLARLEDSFKQQQAWLSANKSKIVKWYETAAEAQQLYYGNEIDAAYGLTDVVMPLVAEDSAYGRAIPTEGTYGFAANYSITTGAPHRDDAYAFIDFLLNQPDTNGEMIRSAGGVSTMLDTSAGLTAEEAALYAFTDEELSRVRILSVTGAEDPRFPMLDLYTATLKEV